MAWRSVCQRLLQSTPKFSINKTSQMSRCLTRVTTLKPFSTDLKANSHNVGQTRTMCIKSGEQKYSGDGMVINIQDEEDFEKRVMNSPVPVLVDFHASWCGPCRLLGPRLEALVGAKDGKVILAKVDVDDNFDIARKYCISSVPTVLGIRNTEIIDKFIGLQDDDIIETLIEKAIG